MTKALSHARLRALRAVIAEKAERHPALRQPLTRRGLRAILERERLTLVVQPCERSAQLVPTPAGWFIILSDATSHAERFVLTLHELAHYWLHVVIDEIVSYDISPPWYDAVREAEADAFAELLIAGPTKRKQASAKSKLPHGGKTTIPEPRVPQWLEEVERDADSIRLRETARAAAREDARQHPPIAGATIQFAIEREAWAAVRFTPGDYPHYTNITVGSHHELVTCTVSAARSIVEHLARAGFKRTAVFVRRRVREALALQPRELP